MRGVRTWWRRGSSPKARHKLAGTGWSPLPTSTRHWRGPPRRLATAPLRSKCAPSKTSIRTDRVPVVDGSEIERVFREEYGRAVAVLVRAFGDIDLAEEAVQDAFAVAVARWPSTGMPPSPAGLVITTAPNPPLDPFPPEASPEGPPPHAPLPLDGPLHPPPAGPRPDTPPRPTLTPSHP